MRDIPQCYYDFVEREEELRLEPYDDRHPNRKLYPGAKISGTLTAGWGHTGPDVVVGMTVTREMAQAWMQDDSFIARNRLYRVVKDDIIDSLTSEQYGAMLSFCLNLGAKPEWTIWKRLNARQFEQVPLEMMKFVNQTLPDGTKVKVDGLVNRRTAEIRLWSTNEPGSVAFSPPSSVTRVAETPPTPSDPVPASKSKAIILGAVGGVASAGPMVDSMSRAITPYASHSGYIAKVLGLLAIIGAIAATASLAYMWVQKRNARN